MKEVAIQEEADTIASEIKELTKASMISTELNEELTSLHKSVYKRLPGTLPLYSVEQSEKKVTKRCKSHDTFIPIEHNGKQIFIHKVTAVWLFQEGERVSSDRLFIVRSKQPHSHEPYKALNVTSEQIDNKTPMVCETIQIGDVCVFSENEEEWKLGRVVKFAFYKERTKTAQQCTSTSINLTAIPNRIGIMCSWFSSTETEGRFSVGTCEEAHVYLPATSYVCTLPPSCFQGDATTKSSSILPVSQCGI